MASPQIEKGYTRIANELLEKLTKYPEISVGELKIILVVMRKTYGYRKKVDRISLSQFELATGFYRANICRIIKKLVARKLLLKKDSFYIFNKNWESWVVADEPLVAHRLTSSSPAATKTSSPRATYKRKKENIQKKAPDNLDKTREQIYNKMGWKK